MSALLLASLVVGTISLGATIAMWLDDRRDHKQQMAELEEMRERWAKHLK